MFKKGLHLLVKGSSISTLPPKNSPVRNTLNVVFGKYLLVTNTVSSGVLMFFGDLIQQEFEFRSHKLPERYDYNRLGRMFLTGIGMGPVHHYYYTYLNKIYPRRDFNSITKKVLLDQFVASPVCIAQFFYSIGLLEGKSVQECTSEMGDKFIEVYKMDWCIWPPTQYFNFYLIPDKYQVFYINVITMLYNVFLSFIKHKEQADEFGQKLSLKDASAG